MRLKDAIQGRPLEDQVKILLNFIDARAVSSADVTAQFEILQGVLAECPRCRALYEEALVAWVAADGGVRADEIPGAGGTTPQ